MKDMKKKKIMVEYVKEACSIYTTTRIYTHILRIWTLLRIEVKVGRTSDDDGVRHTKQSSDMHHVRKRKRIAETGMD